MSQLPVFAYRLIKARFLDTPLSAEGARLWGGRWNPPGVGILYTSATPELTLLEQLVHLPTMPYADLPALHLLTLALPEPPHLLTLTELPPIWRDESEFRANHEHLADWLRQPDVLALGVPSAVVPESFNYLVHPRHPLFARIEVVQTKPFPVDPRLWRTPSPDV